MDIRQNPYRADFPLLAGHPEIAFLDSAATAQRPACALDAQRRFYETMNANPLRGLYSLSVAATAAIADVRAQVPPEQWCEGHAEAQAPRRSWFRR